MGDESSDAMNLDLNLGPIFEPEPDPDPGSGSIASEAVNLDELLEPVRRIREAVRRRASQQGWRWRQMHTPLETQNISMELSQLMANSGNGGSLQAGEGSVAAEERIVEVSKACENNNGFLEEDDSDKKVDTEKGSGTDGSFFDCNICFDLAKDPVVTSCGHLFCWPCLYRWLHVFSDAKECPVCKGEVTIKNLIPIYGRGSSTNTCEPEEDSSLKIPVRPHACRVESLRQTLPRTLAYPFEDVIRHVGRRFDLSRDLIAQQDADTPRETGERSSFMLNRIWTRGVVHREQNPLVPPDENVDLTHSDTTSPDTWETRRFRPALLRRPQMHRAAIPSPFTSALTSAERFVDSYIQRQTTGRSQEQQAPPVDDRDSFSSIAAVINSESQTMDTTVEIDSMLSHSTSSSRRRTEASRVPDVDSGESRAPRRRRLH